MNELTTIDQAELAELAKELGATSSARTTQRVPVLRINRLVEDDDGRELPRGQIFLTGDNPAYADYGDIPSLCRITSSIRSMTASPRNTLVGPVRSQTGAMSLAIPKAHCAVVSLMAKP
jgi:hypothetical protein